MAHESEIEPLVTEVLAGRTDKFREIVRRYQRPLYNFVLNRVGDPSRARVLAADLFVLAHRSLADFAGSRTTFRIWLYRLAFKLCLDWLRQGGRHEWTRHLPGQTRRALMFAWLAGAPPADREVLVMRYIDGMRDQEIAAVTGLDVDAVRARVRAGLRALSRPAPPKEAECNGM